MYQFGNPEALETYRADAGLVFSMTAGVLMFTAMAVSREFPAHCVVAAKVKAVMDRFTSDGRRDET